jgi:Ca-activated chloride channel family protein
MGDFHFLRPYFLWALIPLGLALWVTFKRAQTSGEWKDICDNHLLKHLMVPLSKSTGALSFFLCALTGLLMIVSLSGPSWKKLPETSYSQKRAFVIALDLSSDMLAEDITPSRIERTKYKVRDILNELEEGQVGLVVFSDEPFIVSPLTTDADTLKLLLPTLTPNIMPVDGSNIKKAIEMSSELISQAGFEKGTVFLLTSSEAKLRDISEAKALAKKGITISVIGVGTKLGAPIVNQRQEQIMARLDPSSLMRLAKAGKGVYIGVTNDNHDLRTLLKSVTQTDLIYKKDTQDISNWKDSGRFLLFFILPFVLLSFRRGWFQGLML